MLVIGTRPEAIKLAPLAHALNAAGWRPTIVLTGQHPGIALGEIGLSAFPRIQLRCRGQEAPLAHVRHVARSIRRHIKPSTTLVIVHGDTSSALAGAVAARVAGVPVAHVEAGLRTHDLEQPWPEEGFRIGIDRRAELLFAPTELSAANLRRERVRGEVHVTGNTAIDALLAMDGRSRATPTSDRAAKLLVTCHRRENWNSGLAGVAAALRQIATELPVQIDAVLHPNRALAGTTRSHLSGCPNVRLLPPCDHRTMLDHMSSSDLILSDSGGIQEEASALGIPLLVLREVTERPEAIVTGNMTLVGTNPTRIVAAVRRLLDRPASLQRMSRPALPFGQGGSSAHIAAIIDQWVRATRPLIPAVTTAAA